MKLDRPNMFGASATAGLLPRAIRLVSGSNT